MRHLLALMMLFAAPRAWTESSRPRSDAASYLTARVDGSDWQATTVVASWGHECGLLPPCFGMIGNNLATPGATTSILLELSDFHPVQVGSYTLDPTNNSGDAVYITPNGIWASKSGQLDITAISRVPGQGFVEGTFFFDAINQANQQTILVLDGRFSSTLYSVAMDSTPWTALKSLYR